MAAKRALDLVLAGLLLVGLVPVLVVCAGLVLALDGRPVLFSQVRVGRAGRPFRILKFRTMRPGSGGPLVTQGGDPRVTPLGRWLRRLKLDELPQLWHVVVGEMSLVGPRPEVPHYVSLLPHGFRAISALRPGITDWASLAFRDEEQVLAAHAGDTRFYAEVLLPRKVALARLYLRRRSLGLDLSLVAATAALVLRSEGLMRQLAGATLLARARAGIAP